MQRERACVRACAGQVFLGGGGTTCASEIVLSRPLMPLVPSTTTGFVAGSPMSDRTFFTLRAAGSTSCSGGGGVCVSGSRRHRCDRPTHARPTHLLGRARQRQARLASHSPGLMRRRTRRAGTRRAGLARGVRGRAFLGLPRAPGGQIRVVHGRARPCGTLQRRKHNGCIRSDWLQ